MAKSPDDNNHVAAGMFNNREVLRALKKIEERLEYTTRTHGHSTGHLRRVQRQITERINTVRSALEAGKGFQAAAHVSYALNLCVSAGIMTAQQLARLMPKPKLDKK